MEEEKKPVKKVEVECEHCGYTWECRSTHKYVSCPSCMGKTQVKGS